MSSRVVCKIVKSSNEERTCYQCKDTLPIGSRLTKYVKLSTYEEITLCDHCKAKVVNLVNFLIAR